MRDSNFLQDALNAVSGKIEAPGGWVFGWDPMDQGKTPSFTGKPTYGAVPTRVMGHPDVMGMHPSTSFVPDVMTEGAERVRALMTIGANPVTSSAGDALLSVSDPSPASTGRLVNGPFALANAVAANANGAPFAPVGGSANPTSLLTYTGPTSANVVTLGFRQQIGRLEALRTGAYSKTLTFTLSTPSP